MLVNSVMYTFASEDADRIEELFHELRDAARTEPGCRRFDVARANEDAAVFTLWEEYDDQAALDAHYASEHFKRLGLGGVRPLAKSRVGHLCHLID